MRNQTSIRKTSTRTALVLLLSLFFIQDQVIGQDQVVIAGNIQIKEVWIPLKDGTNLAVDLYMSVDMKQDEKLPCDTGIFAHIERTRAGSGRLGYFLLLC